MKVEIILSSDEVTFTNVEYVIVRRNKLNIIYENSERQLCLATYTLDDVYSYVVKLKN